MRKVPLIDGEYYHIYNRGVDERRIFESPADLNRFIQSLIAFNDSEPVGSLQMNEWPKYKSQKSKDRLVDIVCYCLNPNHFHLLLKQRREHGISEFMRKVGTGYTQFFNIKYQRSGCLFQGKFKSVHVDSNEYLIHLSMYINLNQRVHKLSNRIAKLSKSSWEEYVEEPTEDHPRLTTDKEIILNQFKGRSDYKKSAEETLPAILEKREGGEEGYIDME